jgi:uncharacterized RDD family membrane protein YckC
MQKVCKKCSALSETDKDFCPECGASYIAAEKEELIGVSPGTRFLSYLLEMVLIIVTLIIGWIIWAMTLSGTGQTPSKKLMGLTVIDEQTEKPMTMGRMFWMRGILGGFVAGLGAWVTLGILYFMPFWDKRNQNLWDRISSSVVIRSQEVL